MKVSTLLRTGMHDTSTSLGRVRGPKPVALKLLTKMGLAYAAACLVVTGVADAVSAIATSAMVTRTQFLQNRNMFIVW